MICVFPQYLQLWSIRQTLAMFYTDRKQNDDGNAASALQGAFRDNGVDGLQTDFILCARDI